MMVIKVDAGLQEERNRQPAVADKAKQYIGIGSKWLRSAGTNIAKVTSTIRITMLRSRPTTYLQLLVWRILLLWLFACKQAVRGAVSASGVGSSL